MSRQTTLKRALVRVRESVEDWALAARANLLPVQSLDLFTFSNEDVVSRFQITTDRVVGGKTDCAFTIKQYQHFSTGVFQGVINHEDENPQFRGGFASVRTKADERVRDLSEFQALEMRVKTDGRPYILNVKCNDYSPDQLWQMRIVCDPFKWTTLAFPFSEFVLTKRGHVAINQSPLSLDSVGGFGILLADGRNGPFKLEMQYLRAIRDFNPSDYTQTANAMIAAAVKEQERLRQQAKQITAQNQEAFKEHYSRQQGQQQVSAAAAPSAPAPAAGAAPSSSSASSPSSVSFSAPQPAAATSSEAGSSSASQEEGRGLQQEQQKQPDKPGQKEGGPSSTSKQALKDYYTQQRDKARMQ